MGVTAGKCKLAPLHLGCLSMRTRCSAYIRTLMRPAILCALLAFVATGQLAHAHRPIFPREASSYSRAYSVADPRTSKAYYLELEEALEPVWFRFDAEHGERIAIQLGLPRIQRLADFRPQAALIGPGLPSIDLPFPVPPGFGGVLLETRGKRPERFDEPITQTSSWILTKESIPVAQGGGHYLAVFAPEGEKGKAWVSIGEREAFRLGDLLLLPLWIREVRAYHEVPGWPSWLVGAAAIAGAALVWLIRKVVAG